jgi:hypothetical protein
VCWSEAIFPLLIPFSVKCFEEIASPDCHQARNDAHSRHCEERSYEAISQKLQFVIAIMPFYMKKE